MIQHNEGVAVQEAYRYIEQHNADAAPNGLMLLFARQIVIYHERLNTPEIEEFAKGVVSEAQHQRDRWGEEHDKAHTPEDWFWRLAYLSTKALQAINAFDPEKAMHHMITSAALLANWHAAVKRERK
jgi:hypothetical protein